MAILDGYKVAIAVIGFRFFSRQRWLRLLGRKFTRTIEYGTAQRCGVIIFCRIRRCALVRRDVSLMQMAKTSGAAGASRRRKIAVHFRSHEPRLPA